MKRLLLWSWLFACLPVFASEVEPEVGEQVEVKLRLLEVAVTDKKGRPLTDLERDDFVVTVGGDPREIVTFERATAHTGVQRPSAAEPTDATPEAGTATAGQSAETTAGRWVVICLDADRIPHVYRNVVLETARALVSEGRPQDRFAVVLLRNGELEYVHDYAPPDEFHLGSLGDAGMLLGRSDDLQRRVNELVELLKPCKVQPDYAGCALTHSDEFLATMRKETSRGMHSMRGLIASMAPLPGRKALVWFSNGFVLQPGEIVLEAITRYLGDPGRVRSRLEDRGSYAYDSLLVEASRARVSVFSLRAGHDASYGMRSAEHATVPRELAGLGANPFRLSASMTEESLRDVAEATGGRVVFTPLKPEVTVDLLDRLDAIYTLGIDIRPGEDDDARARIKLAGRKGRVEHRKRLPRRVRVAADLVATLDAVPPAPGAGPDEQRLLLAVELGRLAVEETADSGKRSRVALYTRLTDAAGNELDRTYEILEIPRVDESEQHFVHWLNYRLDEGEYYGEVSVSDLVGRGTTTVGRRFTVDAARTSR